MCCPHADSLARSPVHSCRLVFVRSSCARFGRARHSSAVIPPAMAGTQDTAPGSARGERRNEEEYRGRGRGRRDLVGARGAGSDRCTCVMGIGEGRGERSTGRSSRMGLEIAHAHRNPSRTNERTSDRRRGCYEPAPLKQLPSSSFRMVSPKVVLDFSLLRCSPRGAHLAKRSRDPRSSRIRENHAI